MSLETWKKEFYQVDADIYKGESKEHEIDCVLHSLRKWIGLREENLEKHKVYKIPGWIIDEHDNEMPINDTTCSLCCICREDYIMHRQTEKHINCSRCSGKIANKENCNKQYRRWMYDDQDPEQMIAWLYKALEYVQGEKTVETEIEKKIQKSHSERLA